MNPMIYYAQNSKEQFPSYDEATQEKRVGTTFYADFKVAEAFGKSAVNDTWRRAWNGWKDDCKYCVELCVVTNHLCWEHHGGNEDLSKWYADKYHYLFNRIFAAGTKEEPLPKGCKPFTSEEHQFAFEVLD